MEDLSSQIPGGPVSGLVPTAQNSADSRPHENNAMTAPGSDPADGVAEHAVPAPDIAAEVHDRTVVTHGDDDGPHGGRPVLVRGAWNDMGGGPAPEGYRHA